MARIERIEMLMVDLAPEVKRSDAIQSFTSQETPIVQITDCEGVTGTGYSYTIGTGGHAIMALLAHDLLPRLAGREANEIERIWRDLLFATHATSVGAVTSLALAAIDTALWDLRCRRAGLPLYQMAGGAKSKIPLYTTEGGWLHIPTEALVEDATQAKAKGFFGSKIKIGKAQIGDDRKRLAAVREAVGQDYEIMTDANQAFTLPQAIRRAKILEEYDIGWFEEPLPADDIGSHAALAARTDVPIAIGESLYSISQFKDYLAQSACSVIQTDVAPIGGITPWLKAAHMAEAHNIPVCPHFLMELHVSLVCAVPNAPWLEYIPQLGPITHKGMTIKDGYGVPSDQPGLGIDWDFEAISGKAILRQQFS